LGDRVAMLRRSVLAALHLQQTGAGACVSWSAGRHVVASSTPAFLEAYGAMGKVCLL
jgi:hypothetical protein